MFPQNLICRIVGHKISEQIRHRHYNNDGELEGYWRQCDRCLYPCIKVREQP